MLTTARERTAPEPSAVLTKAVFRASEDLGLTQRDLAQLLGLSQATVSRLPRRLLDPASKEGEIALLFLRLHRSLDAIIGGDAAKSRRWLHAPNQHVSGVPASLIMTISGLVRVVEYLDAMRGKL